MDESRVKELLGSGVGYREIGKMLGVSEHSVRTFARSLPSLPVVTRSPWREWEETFAQSLLSKGYSFEDVAEKLPGRSVEAVKERNYRSWKISTREDLWSATDEEKAKTMLSSGINLEDAALAVGRSRNAIGVKNARDWHIRVVHGNNDLPKDTFFDAWSPVMAYVLGFVVADGCVIKDLSGVSIRQSHCSGRDFLEGLKVLLGGGVYGPSKDDSYVLSVYSRSMAERLNSLGATPAKSLTVRMPNVPDEFFRDFVRGVFDGDGCVSPCHKKKERPDLRATVASGSSEFKSEMERKVKEKVGISGRFSTWEVVWANSSGRKFLEWLYNGKESSLWMSSKFEKYQKLMADREVWGDRRKSMIHGSDGRFIKR